MNGRRQTHLAARLFDAIYRLAQRYPGARLKEIVTAGN